MIYETNPRIGVLCWLPVLAIVAACDGASPPADGEEPVSVESLYTIGYYRWVSGFDLTADAAYVAIDISSEEGRPLRTEIQRVSFDDDSLDLVSQFSSMQGSLTMGDDMYLAGSLHLTALPLPGSGGEALRLTPSVVTVAVAPPGPGATRTAYARSGNALYRIPDRASWPADEDLVPLEFWRTDEDPQPSPWLSVTGEWIYMPLADSIRQLSTSIEADETGRLGTSELTFAAFEPDRGPGPVFADERYVYWIEQVLGSGGPVSSELWRVRREGGPVTRMVEIPSVVSELAVAGGHVCWPNQHGLECTDSKNNWIPYVAFAGSARLLRTDGTAMYFIGTDRDRRTAVRKVIFLP